LQFSSGSGAIGRTLNKQRFEFWVLDVFSASLEPFLTVFAGFNQVVEYRDGFFIHVGHFSIPCGLMKDVMTIAPCMPASDRLFIRYFSTTYIKQPNLYPFFLHDLSIGLHAECLYFPDA
jgi:hypothetical protein